MQTDYSQASQGVFDAYRNMFLALEPLLDHIAPKPRSEGETDWLQRALTDATQRHAVDLTPFVKTPGKHPVEAFIGAHNAAVRCAVFHAKSGIGQALRTSLLQIPLRKMPISGQVCVLIPPVELLDVGEILSRLAVARYCGSGSSCLKAPVKAFCRDPRPAAGTPAAAARSTAGAPRGPGSLARRLGRL